MKVYLLASDSKPLLQDMRRRLFASEEPCFVVICSQQSAADIEKALGLKPDAVPEFAALREGVRHPCGKHTLIQFSSLEKLRAYSGIRADVVFSDDAAAAARLRAFFKPDGRLVLPAEFKGSVPGFLVPESEEGYRLRGAVKQTAVSEPVCSGDRVLVIGGGLAGAMTAYELSLRGVHPVVIDASAVPGSGASALFAGLIHPHWQGSDSPVFQLTREGYGAVLGLLKRFPETFAPVGVIDSASSRDEFSRWMKAAAEGRPVAMPADFAVLLSAEEARLRSGMPLLRGGWWFERAGLVYAGRLCRTLMTASGASYLGSTAVRLRKTPAGWQAVTERDAVVATARNAVVCAAMGSAGVLGVPQTWFGLSPLYGRISLLRDTDLADLRCAMTGDGYASQTPEGFCSVGATYEPGTEPGISAEEAHAHNLSTFDKLCGRRPEVIARGFYEGVRAVPADRMPLAGRALCAQTVEKCEFRGVPEVSAVPREAGLWICAGFGSRGLTWGYACARAVAADMCGEPSALSASLSAAVDPARFLPKLLAGRRSGAPAG